MSKRNPQKADQKAGPWKLRVERLSDEQLLTAILDTNDPAGLADLSDEPPPEDCQLALELTYEAEADARCVFGHMHKQGLVLKDEQGRRYLIGHDCGRSKFGVEWNLMDNERQRMRDRRDYLVRLRTIGTAIKAESAWLSSLPNHPAVQAFDALRRSLATASHDFYAACRDAIENRGGQYLAPVRVRDHQAEERRREAQEKEKREFAAKSERERQDFFKKFGPIRDRTEPIFKQVSRSFGILQGAPLFVRQEKFSVRVADYVQRLDILADGAMQLPATGDLKEMSKTASTLIRNLNAALAEIDRATEFFSRSHLETLVSWTKHKEFPGFVFSVEAAALRIENKDEQEMHVVRSPVALKAIERTPLLRLIAVL
jgi:hypothetical protein